MVISSLLNFPLAYFKDLTISLSTSNKILNNLFAYGIHSRYIIATHLWASFIDKSFK